MFDTDTGGRDRPGGVCKDHRPCDDWFGTDQTLGVVGAYPVDQLTIPLPVLDPLSRRRSALSASPAAPPSPRRRLAFPAVDKYAFSGTWPDIKPFRIQVVGLKFTDAQKPPSFDSTKNVLTIYLKQADTFDVQMSAFFNSGDVNLLGMWQWALDYLQREAGGSLPAQTTAAAVAGLLYWLTPSHTITFVHPVQRPLVQPTFATFAAQKAVIGQTNTLNWSISGQS